MRCTGRLASVSAKAPRITISRAWSISPNSEAWPSTVPSGSMVVRGAKTEATVGSV
jgi:hypothetical protein